MGMRINQNITAMNSYRNLSVTEGQLSKSLEKLSSGFRINRAADDAAGLGISEKLRGQVNGLNQASSNAQNGISLIQTAEGALNESHSILQRMRELAVQSANDTNTDQDRTQIQKEVNQLSQELSRIGATTEFNTKKLLDGSASSTGLTFQIGANQGQTLNVKIGDVRGNALGMTGEVTSIATTAVTAVAAVAGVTAVPATAGKVTGTTNAATIGTAGTLNLTVNGSAVAVALAAGDTAAVAAGKIQTAMAAQVAGSTAAIDGTGKLVLTSGTTGATSTVTVGTATGSALANLGIATGNTGTGVAAVAGVTAVAAVAAVAVGDEVTYTMTASSLESGDYKVGTAVSGVSVVTNSSGDVIGNYTAGTGKLTNAAGTDIASFAAGTALSATTFSVAGVDVSSTAAAASNAITSIQSAIDKVSDQRSTLGAAQNRLDHTINNLGVAAENLAASESRIRDTDMAAEMMKFTRAQILSQAGTAMLAQANQVPQGVLSLLR